MPHTNEVSRYYLCAFLLDKARAKGSKDVRPMTLLMDDCAEDARTALHEREARADANVADLKSSIRRMTHDMISLNK